jgi:hypothetical protein
MVFVFNTFDEEEVFYNCCCKDFSFWHTSFFLLWSLLMFAWSLFVFAFEFCEILQTLTISSLAQSFKKNLKKYLQKNLDLNKLQTPNPLTIIKNLHNTII